MCTDPGIDIKNPDSVLAGKRATDMLVNCIFLVRSCWIAIESEKCSLRIFYLQSEIINIFYDISSAKIARNPGIDYYIQNITWLNFSIFGVIGQDLFKHGHSHSN